ncbi:FAD/NAD(P)-binding domain-containing protein [Xylona heveae TC161]|uniref:FAD/NAD(P)-binding domain-containing protein n=1 Tax=Xylona heveae (strain CBS 132557 / TC161) TaxID=1328760 RepID=A0A165JA84_XYLHT|nr:FAD/NAD(P)-binding domain-containing protein [Xylona heveae TC161]KZF25962.1 FAD/NAD(P)-binding domain-containing protein [Xylona heveae TC161]
MQHAMYLIRKPISYNIAGYTVWTCIRLHKENWDIVVKDKEDEKKEYKQNIPSPFNTRPPSTTKADSTATLSKPIQPSHIQVLYYPTIYNYNYKHQTMPPLNIAIIGAGPAGCTLARLLHVLPLQASQSSQDPSPPQTSSGREGPNLPNFSQSISFTIFESDTHPNYRSQGGSLDLHTNTGIAALRACGLYDAFLQHARYDGEALLLCDKQGKVYLQHGPGKANGQSGGDVLGANSTQTDRAGARPEIDRAELRRILYESLPEGCIKWDRRLIAILDEMEAEVGEVGEVSEASSAVSPEERGEGVSSEDTESGKEGKAKAKKRNYALKFRDGHGNEHVERGFDLIVGAEGLWSKVRSFIVAQTQTHAHSSSEHQRRHDQQEPVIPQDTKPYYAGIIRTALSIPNAQVTAPEVYKLVNRGSVFAYSDGQSLTAQQLGDGSINVYVSSVREDFDSSHSTTNERRNDNSQSQDQGSKGSRRADDNNNNNNNFLDPTKGRAAKEALLAEYKDWSPDLLNFIHKADDAAVVPVKGLYVLPVGFKWENVPGLTLLGDAAHVMPPYAGEGVNLAMEDALSLAKRIVDAVKGTDSSRGTREHDERQADRKGEGEGEDGQGHAEMLGRLDGQVKDYEEDMFRRAYRTSAVSHGAMDDFFFTPGAPRSTIERWILRMLGFALQNEYPWLYFFLRPVIFAGSYELRR